MSEAGPVLYDPVELRRRIAVSFSIGELRALAESLGVGSIAWERGIDDAAREVVRQCERYAGLPALVARLREERPLVEWPAPALAADGAAAIPRTLVSEAGSAPVAPVPPGGAFAPHPALSASPGAFGPPVPAAPPASAVPAAPPPGPSFRDPYAPPPGPPAIAMPAAPPPSVASAPRAAWPGVVNEPPRPAIGIDPRILIAVAGLMVVAAVIAYLAGRASTVAGGDAASAASASSTSGAPGAPGARGDGPAASVADAFARSFANMARACELPSSAGSNALVFRRIFEHCGPSAPPQQRRPTPSPTAAADGSADPAPAADPPPARNKRPGRGDAPPGEAAPTAKSCVGTCDAQHASCRAHCGPEPIESSAYDGYTRCMGGCLKDASRCRLNCR